MIKKVGKAVVHKVTGTRAFYYRQLEELAQSSEGLRILEIGSGKLVEGRDDYSARRLFPDAAEFRQTDLNGDFGHEVLDVTTMTIDGEYDLILCLNVLEHVYDFVEALERLRRALAPGGRLVIAVPVLFPLHDEPHDYWRFTEHSLRRMLGEFEEVDLRIKGRRLMPYGLFAIATTSS